MKIQKILIDIQRNNKFYYVVFNKYYIIKN
jgi:hypothetical protein